MIEESWGISASKFLTSHSRSVGAPWFKKFFSNFGQVGDCHIPNKRSRRTGNRFGFIRFKYSREVEVAIAKANGLWIGRRNLIVERASFDHEFVTPKHDIQSGNFRQYQVEEKKFDQKYDENGGFVKQVEKNVTLYVQPVATEWLRRSAVAKLKEISTSELIQKAFTEINFNENNFDNGSPLSLVLQQWSSSSNQQVKPIISMGTNYPVRKKPTVDSPGPRKVKNWFKSIKPRNGEAAGTSRLVWLKCRGMPLNSWCYQTFKRIGEIWSNFITLDVETLKEETFDVGRMLVSTDFQQKIDEWVNIVVRGKNYQVKVWEEVCDDFFNEKSVRDWVKSHLPDCEGHIDSTIHSNQVEKGNKINSPRINDNSSPDMIIKNPPVISVETPQGKNGPVENEEIANQNVNTNILKEAEGKELNQLKNFEVVAPNLANGSPETINETGGTKQTSGSKLEKRPRRKLNAKVADNVLETIIEEDEESMVGETPNVVTNPRLFEEQEVVLINDEQFVDGPNNSGAEPNLGIPKSLIAREKRAKLRKNIRDILGDNDEEGRYEDSLNKHSDSINSEDILRRNSIIIKGFEEQTSRLGVVHHESEAM
ncbi:hypothetical protein Vadar_021208 [Vaccinium darrowii]|uniref:Uncharacterized protein n=1 Tax=Vaccinium darrowii TaxID=229202 RepID=A0ACB7Z5R3_9ERIC|nr:hypothetical protein Vadar_021208 [Vaccinium darrowii]